MFVRRTSKKLTVWDISSGFCVIVLTFGMGGIGLILSSFSVTTLTCDRLSPTQGSCYLVDFSLPWPKLRNIPLNTLQGVYLKRGASSRRTSPRSHLVLLTQRGEISIAASSPRQEQEYFIYQLESFITNPNERFLKVRLEGLRQYFFSGFFLWGCGAVSLLLIGDQIEILSCKFDKNLGRITLEQRNFLSRSTGFLEWSIEEIESVNVDSVLHSRLNRWLQYENYKKYYLFLLLKSGEQVRLTSYETILLKSKQKIADYIGLLLSQNRSLGDAFKQEQKREQEELTQQSTIEKEVATWQEAIRLNPNNAEAHYQLGLALYRQGKRKEASTHLQLAKELFNAEGNSKKAKQVQGLLWEWGLE